MILKCILGGFMNKELRSKLDETSEKFLEDLKLRSISYIKMYSENKMPVIILKSRLGVNYKYLSRILSDKNYFELNSPTKIININTLAVKLTEASKKKGL